MLNMYQRILITFILVFCIGGGYAQYEPILHEKALKQNDSIVYIDSIFYLTWNSDIGNWERQQKYSFTYDTSGNTVTEFEHCWQNGKWEPDIKTNYSYNGSNLIQKIKFEWDSYMEFWQEIQKRALSYSGEKLIQTDIDMWSFLYEDWYDDSIYTYTYNSIGKRAEQIEEYWHVPLNSWFNRWKFNYSYNTDSLLKQKIKYDWDLDLILWKGILQNFYSYDSIGRLIEDLQQSQDLNSYVWINNILRNYNYNNQGLISEFIASDWYEDGAFWIQNTKYTYLYNSEGKLTKRQRHWFDHDISIWENFELVLNNYTDDGYLTSTTIQIWNSTNNTWQNTERYYYFYSPASSIFEIAETNSVSVYPNPATSILKLSATGIHDRSSIYLFDNLGRLKVRVQDIFLNEETTLEVSDLPRGIYLLIIETGNGRIVRKVILS